MSARLSLSIIAAVALGVAGRVALAADDSSTEDQVEAAEQGLPASVDNAKRPALPRSTDAEIESLEEGNPASVDYPNRPKNPPLNKAEFDAAEKGNPHSYDNRDAHAPAPKPAEKAQSAAPDARPEEAEAR